MSNRLRTVGEVSVGLALVLKSLWSAYTSDCRIRVGKCFYDPTAVGWLELVWSALALLGLGVLAVAVHRNPKPPDGLKNPMFSRGYALVDGESPAQVQAAVTDAVRTLGRVTPTATGAHVGARGLSPAVDIEVDAHARTVRATLVRPRWRTAVMVALGVACVAIWGATPWLQWPPVHPSPFPITPRWVAMTQLVPLYLWVLVWKIEPLLHLLHASGDSS